MTSKQILDIIAANRDYLKIKSNNALQNLALLHHSFDTHTDEDIILSLSLNDSVAAIVFGADYAGAIALSQQVIDRFFGSRHIYYIASHEMLIGRCHALRTFTTAGSKSWCLHNTYYRGRTKVSFYVL